MNNYASVHITDRDYNILKKKADYALLPVWMINYDYRDGQYVFAMNGDTGKIVGKPPISKAKVMAWLFGVGGGLFLILRLITIFFTWRWYRMMKSKRFTCIICTGAGFNSRAWFILKDMFSAEVLEDYYLEGNGNSLKWESAVNDYLNYLYPGSDICF